MEAPEDITNASEVELNELLSSSPVESKLFNEVLAEKARRGTRDDSDRKPNSSSLGQNGYQQIFRSRPKVVSFRKQDR